MATTGLQILTPTDDQTQREREINNGYKHLLPRFRQGTVSFEVFDRRKRETSLGVGFTHDPMIEDVPVPSPEPPKTKARSKGHDKDTVINARSRKKGK